MHEITELKERLWPEPAKKHEYSEIKGGFVVRARTVVKTKKANEEWTETHSFLQS